MLHRYRFVLGGLVVVLTSSLVSYAVSARVPSAFLAAGTTRYAIASVSASNSDTTNSTTYVDLNGMKTTVVIPPGMVGDVIVLFCADVAATDTFLMARARIGNTVLQPGDVILREYTTTPGAGHRCANFQRSGIAEGTKTVKVQWASAGGLFVNAYARSLLVIVNLR